MIAGGASWPHWLRGTVIEGKRWLDDAFACAGEADERTRALALTGRGLIDFLAGSPEHSDEDLEAAIEIFRRYDDVESLRAGLLLLGRGPAALGDIDEARRRRLQLIDFWRRHPRASSTSLPSRTRGGSSRSSTATSKRPSGTTGPPRKASPGSTGRS